jgi:hypothetical protein
MRSRWLMGTLLGLVLGSAGCSMLGPQAKPPAMDDEPTPSADTSSPWFTYTPAERPTQPTQPAQPTIAEPVPMHGAIQ